MVLKYNLILDELNDALGKSNFDQLDSFVSQIQTSERIVVYGAGRVGLVMKSFSMRLNHLGLKSYFLNDSNMPKMNKSDLLIVGSGSGSTPSIATIVDIAFRNKIKIICITADENSEIAGNSSFLLIINAPTKNSDISSINSIQPMTTLFEQALLIVLDSLVLNLMESLHETHDTMVKRHNNLE